jgi:Ca2+-transporting ATPase
MTNWHSLDAVEVLRLLDSSPDGLSETEVADRIKHWGTNELNSRKPIPVYKLFLKQFASYFILVLLFAAALAYGVSYLPGQEERRLTAYFILVIIFITVLLGFFEEYRSQRELEALGKLLVFRTTVIREGARKVEVQVVPGDVIVLSRTKAPADGHHSNSLHR